MNIGPAIKVIWVGAERPPRGARIGSVSGAIEYAVAEARGGQDARWSVTLQSRAKGRPWAPSDARDRPEPEAWGGSFLLPAEHLCSCGAWGTFGHGYSLLTRLNAMTWTCGPRGCAVTGAAPVVKIQVAPPPPAPAPAPAPPPPPPKRRDSRTPDLFG